MFHVVHRWRNKTKNIIKSNQLHCQTSYALVEKDDVFPLSLWDRERKNPKDEIVLWCQTSDGNVLLGCCTWIYVFIYQHIHTMWFKNKYILYCLIDVYKCVIDKIVRSLISQRHIPFFIKIFSNCRRQRVYMWTCVRACECTVLVYVNFYAELFTLTCQTVKAEQEE